VGAVAKISSASGLAVGGVGGWPHAGAVGPADDRGVGEGARRSTAASWSGSSTSRIAVRGRAAGAPPTCLRMSRWVFP